MKKIVKYIALFLATIVILFFLQALVIRIPNRLIKNNMLDTIDYYEKRFPLTLLIPKLEKLNNVYLKNSFLVDDKIDALTLNLLWNVNNNRDNLWESQIAMNFFYNIAGGFSYSLKKTVLENPPLNMEYSRYWHGSIFYLKPLLIFFDISQIKIINAILLGTLTIYLLYSLFKKSKSLAVAFLLGFISINIFIVPFCFEYYFIFLIMIISSIITLNVYNKKDTYFYYLLLINGVLSCFFDFLTCETLTLTIPLLIYLYLKYDKNTNQKQTLLFIVKSGIIWGISYFMTYLAKWIISVIVVGSSNWSEIFHSASIRIYNTPFYGNPIVEIFNIVKTMFCSLFPFNLFSKSAPVAVLMSIILLTMFYFLLLRKSQRRCLKFLVLVSLIGVLRLVVLYAHSFQHYFFDYRALLPLVITAVLIVLGGVKNEVEYHNTMSKRGSNNRGSNKSSKKVHSKKKVK